MPDSARVWVFAAERPLAPDEAGKLLATVDDFLAGWKAHGTPLTASRDWHRGQFLIVAVDEASAPPSGCSIDALVRSLKGLESELGVTLLDNSPVWFLQEGEVRSVPRAAFRALAQAGEVGPDTLVFDNTITRLDSLRRGELERPARGAWHGRAFFPAERS